MFASIIISNGLLNVCLTVLSFFRVVATKHDFFSTYWLIYTCTCSQNYNKHAENLVVNSSMSRTTRPILSERKSFVNFQTIILLFICFSLARCLFVSFSISMNEWQELYNVAPKMDRSCHVLWMRVMKFVCFVSPSECSKNWP